VTTNEVPAPTTTTNGVRWNLKELSASLAYGELYVVAKVETAQMWLARIRKKKGHFGIESKPLAFTKVPTAEPGQFLFRERDGRVTHLQPDGVFAEHINKALVKVKVRK
jgi:hypothetical protein